MKIIEIGTGYTSIPARMGAATEIVVEELTRALLRRHADVQIVDIRDPDRLPTDLPIREVPMPRWLTRADVQLGLIHKLKRVIYSVALARTLRQLIRESGQPLIFHFHNQYNMYFFYKLTPVRLRKKVKIAYTNHSYIWSGQWEDIAAAVRKRYFQEVFCLRHADLDFVLNGRTAVHLTGHLGVPPSRVRRIINGVNTDVYRPLAGEEARRIRKELDLENRRVFFQAGSVCPRKNQMDALKMLTPFLRQDPRAMYAYAGGIIDGEYQAALARYAREQDIAGQVRYVGELGPGEELNRYYATADAFVFPSLSEAFGLVIVEAMAAGTPVLVDRAGAVDLTDELKNVILPYDSPESFAGIVHGKILNADERREISRAAREFVRAHYSWDAAAEMYQSALGGFLKTGETA